MRKTCLTLIVAAMLAPGCGSDGWDGEDAVSDVLVVGLETDAVMRIVDEESAQVPEVDTFREIVVGADIGGDSDRPVDADVVGLLAYGGRTARFTIDPDAVIAGLDEAGTTDVAVVVIDDLRFDDDRAEIEVHLWCCDGRDVAVTYEAEMGPEWFIITGVAD